MMSVCKISLPGPVSRSDISTLVVELIKLLLYHRGQFPMPLEEARKLVKQKLSYHESFYREVPNQTSQEKSVKQNFVIYEDPSGKTTHEACTGMREKKLNVMMQKVEKQFCESVMQFENYFYNLQYLLENNNISEVVLNIGRNFRQPSELFYIKLPLWCKNCKHFLSLKRCKLHLIKTVIENETLWNETDPEILMPISVMIMIPSHMPIAENMEQKTLYKIPTRGKSHVFELMNLCSHVHRSLDASLEEIKDEHKVNYLHSTHGNFDESCTNDATSETHQGTHLWVQLKPVLKGFKDNMTPKAPENSIWL